MTTPFGIWSVALGVLLVVAAAPTSAQMASAIDVRADEVIAPECAVIGGGVDVQRKT
ncbi:MAG: hypothetical protein ABL982_17635 [Vicinamibacterales bacterium]